MKYVVALGFAVLVSVGFVSEASAWGQIPPQGGGGRGGDSAAQVPEIDPAGALPALGLALGGLAVLAGRRKRKAD